MNWSFECESYGKWILAGEHAVLRGSEALVFPIAGRSFRLRFRPTTEPLQAVFLGPSGSEYQLLFWGVLENALSQLHHQRHQLNGEFEIHTNLPLGAGLGASAALCVAVARWCEAQGLMSEFSLYDFARTLENFFHGESSGVDIAVALQGAPLKFRRGEPFQNFEIQWQPRLYLSYSGRRGMTADCVAKVKLLIEKDPVRGQKLDQLMGDAVASALTALTVLESPSAFLNLKKSLNLAEECFQAWGLVNGELHSHMSWLKDQGAVAVKPTGSGEGGFVLSLWDHELPTPLTTELIRCF